MNDLMKEIADLEKGIIINNKTLTFYVLFGSFDKQARALILNCQACTGEYGCVFCLSRLQKINGKPVYLEKGIKRNKYMQIAAGIQAEQSRKIVKGIKGISCLR